MVALMTISVDEVSQCDTPRKCTHDYRVNCNSCRLASICLPLALSSDDVEELDNIVQRGKTLQKGEHLYQEGSAFSSVYAVRSGAIKAYRQNRPLRGISSP